MLYKKVYFEFIQYNYNLNDNFIDDSNYICVEQHLMVKNWINCLYGTKISKNVSIVKYKISFLAVQTFYDFKLYVCW